MVSVMMGRVLRCWLLKMRLHPGPVQALGYSSSSRVMNWRVCAPTQQTYAHFFSSQALPLPTVSFVRATKRRQGLLLCCQARAPPQSFKHTHRPSLNSREGPAASLFWGCASCCVQSLTKPFCTAAARRHTAAVATRTIYLCCCTSFILPLLYVCLSFTPSSFLFFSVLQFISVSSLQRAARWVHLCSLLSPFAALYHTQTHMHTPVC